MAICDSHLRAREFLYEYITRSLTKFCQINFVLQNSFKIILKKRDFFLNDPIF